MYEWARRFPPVLVRLMARERYGPALSTQVIAKRSGLSPVFIETLSLSTTWNGVDIWQMRAFTTACGVDFENGPAMKRIVSYLQKQRNLAYLTRSKDWGSYYLPLLIAWAKSVAASPPDYKPLRLLFDRVKCFALKGT